MQNISEGTKVLTKRLVDRHPNFIIPAGKMGVVDFVDPGFNLISVKFYDKIYGNMKPDNSVIWGADITTGDAATDLLNDCEILEGGH
jgi:hypothetical protein